MEREKERGIIFYEENAFFLKMDLLIIFLGDMDAPVSFWNGGFNSGENLKNGCDRGFYIT